MNIELLVLALILIVALFAVGIIIAVSKVFSPKLQKPRSHRRTSTQPRPGVNRVQSQLLNMVAGDPRLSNFSVWYELVTLDVQKLGIEKKQLQT